MPSTVNYTAGKEAEILSNPNSLWGFIFVELLHRSGVREIVVSPGSRSTPLMVAIERHPGLRTTCIVDERSASFFALGLAKASTNCVALLCTSGSAGGHYLPAVMEASETNTPLLILTADRPPELHGCHSGQTTDQQKLFGGYVRLFQELPVPSESHTVMRHLREVVPYAVERSQAPLAGPVHLNCPIADPLTPGTGRVNTSFEVCLAESFFADINKAFPEKLPANGLIIAGTMLTSSGMEDCTALAAIQKHTGWPVLADVMAPWRFHSDLFEQVLITQYENILQNARWAETLRPDFVLQIGQLPTGKNLRGWLSTLNVPVLTVDEQFMSLDPLGRGVHYCRHALSDFGREITESAIVQGNSPSDWSRLELFCRNRIAEAFSTANPFFEGRLSRAVFQRLPASLDIFIANGMIVRDAESYWTGDNSHRSIYQNRGLNGIDGILSTAMGVALAREGACLFTGDLSFLHDTNGLLQAKHFPEHLAVVVMDNAGGGIFEHLPIAEHGTVFERYFACPQTVDLALLCEAYGVHYKAVDTEDDFGDINPVRKGVFVYHLKTNRKQDAAFRKQLRQTVSHELDLQ
ncbi:MAG: 2-succinyl-5-enolpyruvyl-6-hydroxy-3-cyclohexene-1-carboxylic-acid synthase [Opitutales bacterium]|nr:2-succinyl-5-enolpyruvyl-6-hydroxy-3-cyclohexene-1-carboxylic-acid synthase [Opitutales bacterium]